MNKNNKSATCKLWYAIYVRSRHEKTVHEALRNKGIESSLPMKTVYHQWSDRKKKVSVPMFRGYIFVRINLKIDKLNVLQTPSVIKFIQFNNRIPIIPEKQIFWLQTLLTSAQTIHYEKQYQPGAAVEVVTGPFKGLKGNIINKKSVSCVTLWIDIIMQGVSVEMDPICIDEIISHHH